MKETWEDLRNIAVKCQEKKKAIGNRKVILFGAGALGVSAYKTIKEEINVSALADNNLELQGKTMTKYDGLNVLSLEEVTA